jgi:hypothetical protein
MLSSAGRVQIYLNLGGTMDCKYKFALSLMLGSGLFFI